jgi:hypothetical protein
MDKYQDPILSAYAKLIKDATGDTFKVVYFGDPIRVPRSMIPCLILSKVNTDVRQFSNQQDEHAIKIIATVITDVRDEKDMNDQMHLADGISQLYDIIEGRKPDFSLKDASLLNILRKEITVDTGSVESKGKLRTNLATITRAEYGITIDKRSENGFATEASVEFIGHFIQMR